MSLPFARSERSLQTDDYRTALISVGLAFPLFIAWFVWFFAGDMPINVMSSSLSSSGSSTVVANFDLDTPPNIKPGDPIRLRLQLPDASGLTTIPATVWDIVQQADGSYDVELLPDINYVNVSTLEQVDGQVMFDEDDQSPFEYLLSVGGAE